MTLNQFFLDAAEKNIRVESASFTWDKEQVVLNGDVNFSEANPRIFSNLSREILIWRQRKGKKFFLGGSGGSGVLVARDAKNGEWSQPAFYTLGSVTLGLQIGGEAAEVIMMIRTQKALDALYATEFKLGGDTSAAAGPVGVGAKSDVTADVVSFAKFLLISSSRFGKLSLK